MANTINTASVIVSNAQAHALIRTSLAKSGSCKTMKGNSTADVMLVDKSRGEKYAIDATVRMTGTISVEQNGTIKKRLDRFKLFTQAVINLTRNGAPINKALIIGEMDRLWTLHKDNRDLKQIDSETFDSALGELFGREFSDRMYAPVDETAPKAGDFSVSDLSIDILNSIVGAVGSENPAVWNSTPVPVAAATHAAGGPQNEADAKNTKTVRRKRK
jgi:hypothetical protein